MAIAADGLVTIEPNRGAGVAGLDRAGLRSLFELAPRSSSRRRPPALRRHLEAGEGSVLG